MFIYEKEDKISRKKIFLEFWNTYLEKSLIKKIKS